MTKDEAIAAATEEQKRTGKYHVATYRAALAGWPLPKHAMTETRAMEVGIFCWIEARARRMLQEEQEKGN